MTAPRSVRCPARRRLLNSLLVAPVTLYWPAVLAQSRRPTPEDDIGPFHPPDWTGEIDADLTRWLDRNAQGERLLLTGAVTDTQARPVAGAFVEIWQADGRGRYRFPGLPEAERDRGFQGYGRTETDAGGRYGFQTILPGRYGTRPPHIHLRLIQPGRPAFVTQIYFRGMNTEGGSGGWKPPQRESLTIDLVAADRNRRTARFDIVLAA